MQLHTLVDDARAVGVIKGSRCLVRPYRDEKVFWDRTAFYRSKVRVRDEAVENIDEEILEEEGGGSGRCKTR